MRKRFIVGLVLSLCLLLPGAGFAALQRSGKGVKLYPENGTVITPGQTLTVTIQVMSLLTPADGVWLSIPDSEPLHDKEAPYTFDIKIPKGLNGKLFSVEASAMIGGRRLTDKASYLIHGGISNGLVVVLLFSLIGMAGIGLILPNKLLLGTGVGGALIILVLAVTGYIPIRPHVTEIRGDSPVPLADPESPYRPTKNDWEKSAQP